MGKVIKYLFIALVSGTVIFVILAVGLFLVVGQGFAEADRKNADKDKLAYSAMDQIALYYNKNGYYPKDLSKLPIYSNLEFATYAKEGANVFHYYTYGNDRSKYSFSWNGGAMNWTEYSCTNYKPNSSKNQNGVIRTYPRPNGVICTVTDLH